MSPLSKKPSFWKKVSCADELLEDPFEEDFDKHAIAYS